MFSSIPDLLRLCTIPLFGYAAYTDFTNRRVKKWVWWVLIASGGLITLFELSQLAPIRGEEDIRQVQLIVNSMGILMLIGGLLSHAKRVGLADAKAIITLAVLYPTFPTITLAGYTLPIASSTVGSLSITALLNAFVLGSVYIFDAVKQALKSWFSTGEFKLSEEIEVSNIAKRAGKVHPINVGNGNEFEVDIDTIRMYLRWRDININDIKNGSVTPTTSIGDTYSVSTGAMSDGGKIISGNEREKLADQEQADRSAAPGDEWGVKMFFKQVDADIYGDSPEAIREALEYIENSETIFLKRGYPMVTLLFGGILLSLSVGNIFQLFLSLTL